MPDRQPPESSAGPGESEATFSSPLGAGEGDATELEASPEAAVGELLTRIQAALDGHEEATWSKGSRIGYFRDPTGGYTAVLEEDDPDSPDRIAAAGHKAMKDRYRNQAAVLSLVDDRDFTPDGTPHRFTQYTIIHTADGLSIDQRPLTAELGSRLRADLPTLTPEERATLNTGNPGLREVRHHALRAQKAVDQNQQRVQRNEDLVPEAQVDALQHRIMKLHPVSRDSPEARRL